MQNDNVKFKSIPILLIGLLALAFGWFLFKGVGSPYSVEALDSFASCLTEKGFTMYGAYWCPHCQNEKVEFGESFAKVDYVECTESPTACTEAGITGYPTWIGPDGIRLEGEQGLSRLSEISACPLDSEYAHK